jgi:hypothetical protein
MNLNEFNHNYEAKNRKMQSNYLNKISVVEYSY